MNQTYRDYEVVIVDDGSTDDSVSIIESFNDSRIKLFSQKNQGPSSARNLGIEKAQNEWLIFLDADDVMMPDALEQFSYYISNYPGVDILCGGYSTAGKTICRFPDVTLINNGFRAFVLNWLALLAGTFVCRRENCRNTLYDARLWRLEDIDFMMRLFRISSCILYFPKIVVRIEERFANLSVFKQPITKDYRGYLDLSGKSFWEKVSIYHLYNSARDEYPEEAEKLYPSFKYRFFLRLSTILINYYRFYNKR